MHLTLFVCGNQGKSNQTTITTLPVRNVNDFAKKKKGIAKICKYVFTQTVASGGQQSHFFARTHI